MPDEAWRSLCDLAQGREGIELRKYVPDLCAELSSAVASVSQCGYNTVLDILRAGIPALVVPFAEGREDEQTGGRGAWSSSAPSACSIPNGWTRPRSPMS